MLRPLLVLVLALSACSKEQQPVVEAPPHDLLRPVQSTGSAAARYRTQACALARQSAYRSLRESGCAPTETLKDVVVLKNPCACEETSNPEGKGPHFVCKVEASGLCKLLGNAYGALGIGAGHAATGRDAACAAAHADAQKDLRQVCAGTLRADKLLQCDCEPGPAEDISVCSAYVSAACRIERAGPPGTNVVPAAAPAAGVGTAAVAPAAGVGTPAVAPAAGMGTPTAAPAPGTGAPAGAPAGAAGR